MDNNEIRALSERQASNLNATADRLATAIPAMESEVSRLYEALLTAELTGGPVVRIARNKWRAAVNRLHTRIDAVAYNRNRAADLTADMTGQAFRRFSNRPRMIDLPVYRLPDPNGKARGTDPVRGKSMVIAGESRTTFDKPYAYSAGLTWIGYTTDNTYAVNGANRAADRHTGKVAGRARQIHGPEPTQTGLRVSLQSEYLFWKVSEYHRKLITRPAGKDENGNPKVRVISRPAYDKAAGYVTDIPTCIRRLVSISKAIADPVEYPGNQWVLSDRPRYNREQIDGMIDDLKAIANGPYADRFTKAQYTPADLYGYADMESRIKAITGKTIRITKLGQWHYWNRRIIREIKATVTVPPDPEPEPATVPPPQISLSGHGKTPYTPCKPSGIGNVAPRVRKAKNGRIMVDGRFAPAWTPKGTGTAEGTALAERLAIERADRWADWWNRNTR